MRLYLLLLISMSWIMASNNVGVNSYHDDSRKGLVKLEFVDHYASKAEEADLAFEYLENHYHQYGLPSDLSNIQLAKTRESLVGHHYYFHQFLNDISVHSAEIIVSVSKIDGQVYMVFNNTYPVHELDKRQPSQAAVAVEQAYDIAWQDLRVHGDLLAEPSDRLIYYPEDGRFRLVYLITLSTEAPLGTWEHRIDAETGDILGVRDIRISERPSSVDFASYEGPVWDRRSTTQMYIQKQSLAQPIKGKKADGTGTVFDPDPVTTLATENLQDSSPASAFNNAYVTRTLRDITQSGGNFSLVGPWIQVVNVASPNTAPSTTANGTWSATRGDNSFNDAMTYFHIDQSQRYIQSLGFTGGTGIQFGSIRVDTDGAGGADNSFFDPNDNHLEFGHGCVDDNEDAFVILHEYGHAMQWNINSNWTGGDTGGMGEGFGDYWAGSYKFSTPNGPTFHPEWAFPWDGHVDCWPGRLMNQTSFQYNPNATYGAHQNVGGILSDELWSTPLFQSLVTLVGQGVPRSQVDQVILQAHFGLGSGIKIPEMAQAIVNAAQQLYPNGAHAQVFHDKFAVHNIQTTVSGGPPPTGSGTKLVYAWVSNNSQFESILVVNNYGDAAASLTLTAQRATGLAETVIRSVPAGGFLNERASSLFPSLGNGVGYTVQAVSDKSHVRGRWVTNNLEAASGKSPSQGVAVLVPEDENNPGERVGKQILFGYLPTTGGLTSAPVIVNIGDAATNVTMKFYNSAGTLVATDSTTLRNLEPFRPFATVANNLVPSTAGDVYMIAESSGELITGVAFVFNNFSEPAIGNVTAIAGSPSGGGGNTNALQNGVPVSDLSGTTGEEARYTFEIPAGRTSAAITLSGGTGDADLFVKLGSEPTRESFDAISQAFGNTERIDINNPAAGTYHIMLYAFETYSGTTLTASYQ